jgi:hypothetical protein
MLNPATLGIGQNAHLFGVFVADKALVAIGGPPDTIGTS